MTCLKKKIAVLCGEYGISCDEGKSFEESIFMAMVKMRQDLAVMTSKYIASKDEEFRLHCIIDRFDEMGQTFPCGGVN